IRWVPTVGRHALQNPSLPTNCADQRSAPTNGDHRRAIDLVAANLGWRFAFMPTKVGIYQQRVIAGH
ncbi:hypothetical protein, partial [Stenotrophomonas maltophilia]|uniref:hypothetical protein n=1 Tax=Stenotrophomonas maltophilia TaxID=40324 RepID=UPI0019540D12